MNRKGSWTLRFGANPRGRDRTHFRVWAPRAGQVRVKLMQGPSPAYFDLHKKTEGIFEREIAAAPGDRYLFSLGGDREHPDPVSRFQPEGVHGPSQIVDPGAFRWTDGRWKGVRLEDCVFYEIHTAAFTPQATFEGILRKISYLKKLGVTCIEIMPVAQFPGKHNWGYDGVGLYAVQNSYGGPDGLKKLVNACHRAGMAVCLDVVYNHLGPEGNYLHAFGPYFTDKYLTPWGEAVNYDGHGSPGVRCWVVENALYWVTEYHIDVLRLDAIHGIFDSSPKHILREIKERVEAQSRALGRRVLVIPESDLNDSRVIRPFREDGYGLDAQWNDDYHHAVHTALTEEAMGYYQDFTGLRDVVKALEEGFVYDGKYSKFRSKNHGNSVKDLPREKLVVFLQNHDQVGNRAYGERLSSLAPAESLKTAAVLLLLGPNTPLLFMGEEYAEKAPFQYFVDHGDEGLNKAVREGRRREFAAFGWSDVPDPASTRTFQTSRLDWKRLRSKPHSSFFKLYQDLIRLRKKIFGPGGVKRSGVRVRLDSDKQCLRLEYPCSKKGHALGAFVSFSETTQTIRSCFDAAGARILLHTAWRRYGGKARDQKTTPKGELTLPPRSAVVMEGRMSS